jgi:cyclopropane fatty-acyl-phospholipid synthase-like methyltransferase
MESSRNIYARAFADSQYCKPALELRYDYAVKQIDEHSDSRIIDIGVGRGAFADYVKSKLPNVVVDGIDLDIFYESNNISTFFKGDLNANLHELCGKIANIKGTAYGTLTCLDVLEHLNKESIDSVFEFFSNISVNQVFTIANHSDIHEGTELHIIQENLDWWLPKLQKYFIIDNVETHYNGRLYLLSLTTK